MSRAAAAVLLAQLKGRGVELFAAGDRVHYRPEKSVNGELRKRIESTAPDLLDLLRGSESPQTADALQSGTERTETSPPASRAERPPGPWLTHSFAPITAYDDRERSVPCRCCGSRDFWALITVGSLVCGRCHAPDYAPNLIRWVRIPELDTDA